MTSHQPAHQLINTLSVVDSVLQHIGRRLPDHVSREDLASVGKLALIAALDRFEGPETQARAFCYTRVRGAVLDELRRLDPLSRRTRSRVKTINRATDALSSQLGREPADFEVAAATGLTIGAVRESNRVAVIDFCPIDHAANGVALELRDTVTPGPAESAAHIDTVRSVRAALNRLPRNQALALRRYYLEDATLDEIAGELGVSRERARQVRTAGEKRLRSDYLVLAQWQALFAAGGPSAAGPPLTS